MDGRIGLHFDQSSSGQREEVVRIRIAIEPYITYSKESIQLSDDKAKKVDPSLEERIAFDIIVENPPEIISEHE